MGKKHVKDNVLYIPYNTSFSKLRDFLIATIIIAIPLMFSGWVIYDSLFNTYVDAKGVEFINFERYGDLGVKEMMSPLAQVLIIFSIAFLLSALVKFLYSEFAPNLFRGDGPVWMIFLLPLCALPALIIPFFAFSNFSTADLTQYGIENAENLLVSIGAFGNLPIIVISYLIYVRILFKKKGKHEYRMFHADTGREYHLTDDGEVFFADFRGGRDF